MSEHTPERDYEVGYGKPPVSSRFKPGHSGNPNGRRRGTRNLRTMLDEALNERVAIKENGRSTRITKRELFIKQIVNKGVVGDDPRARDQLMKLILQVGLGGGADLEAEIPDLSDLGTDAEQQVLDMILTRARKVKP